MSRRIPIIEVMDAVLQRTCGPSRHNSILDSLRVTPSAVELAYIAGFFDGEGTCRLRKNKKKHLVFKTVHVNVGQSTPEVLEWLQTFYGGNIYTYSKGGESKRTRDFHQWCITGTRAVKFLRDIYPYCRIKRGDIEHVIQEKYGE